MKWTEEEEDFLIDTYTNEGPTYCAEQLGRSYASVQQKALKLNLTNSWTKKQEQFLSDNYREHGAAHCAEQLGKTVKAVQVKASRLNLTRFKADWSEKEEQFLINNYPNKGLTYCVEQLCRTSSAVKTRAQKLNLKANTRYNSNTVYVVYFPDVFLYKVGITNCVERRIKEFGRFCVILKTINYQCSQEAAEVERSLLKSVSLLNTGELNNGNTETFTQPSKLIQEFINN